MDTKVLSINDPYAQAEAIDILTAGGVVAFPTDTVYGMGALVFNEAAVASIYELRGSRTDITLPILLADFAQLTQVAFGLNSLSEKLARRFWPGPLTLLVPRHPGIPDTLTSFPTVGVRIPDFDLTRELLRLTGPLAVSSANRFDLPSPTTAHGVADQFAGRLPLILDGGVTPGRMPSTVVDCTQGHPELVREGPITFEQILNALN